ncbi:MAG: glycosyltransferase family 4 protein [Patescibacteria group bacterium]
MRKKILIFSTAYEPFMSGAEVAVKEITDRLGESCEFFMITARMDKNLSKKEKIGNINVFRVGFGFKNLDKFLLPFCGLWVALKNYKKENYQIVWSIMASQASIGASFFKILKPQVKLLLTLQEGDEEEYLKRYVGGSDFLYRFLIQPWHLLVFHKADLIQTISFDLKNRALKNEVVCPIEVIPNGVDIENFSQKYSVTELDSLAKSLGKEEDDIFLVHTGRFNYKNGLEDLIKSLIYLPLNIKLLLLGGGIDEEKLKEVVMERSLEKRVKFLGFINHQELPKYLRISDIFVRPSLSEGLGNSFLEAMVVKLAVIATPVGGIPDFLKDEETGLFCIVHNPESIAERVKKILADKKLKDYIVEKAYKMVIKKYDWNLIAVDMGKIFDSLV